MEPTNITSDTPPPPPNNNRRKTIKAYVYKNGTKAVRHVTGEYYVRYKGGMRRVVVDSDGNVLGVPVKLTKKQRRKLKKQKPLA